MKYLIEAKPQRCINEIPTVRYAHFAASYGVLNPLGNNGYGTLVNLGNIELFIICNFNKYRQVPNES